MRNKKAEAWAMSNVAKMILWATILAVAFFLVNQASKFLMKSLG